MDSFFFKQFLIFQFLVCQRTFRFEILGFVSCKRRPLDQFCETAQKLLFFPCIQIPPKLAIQFNWKTYRITAYFVSKTDWPDLPKLLNGLFWYLKLIFSERHLNFSHQCLIGQFSISEEPFLRHWVMFLLQKLDNSNLLNYSRDAWFFVISQECTSKIFWVYYLSLEAWGTEISKKCKNYGVASKFLL